MYICAVIVSIYVASTTPMCEYRFKMRRGCITPNKSHVCISSKGVNEVVLKKQLFFNCYHKNYSNA